MKIVIKKDLVLAIIAAIVCLATICISYDLVAESCHPKQKDPTTITKDNFEPLPKIEETKKFSINKIGILEVELRDGHTPRVYYEAEVTATCLQSHNTAVINFIIRNIEEAAKSEYKKFSYEEWSGEYFNIDAQAEQVFKNAIYNNNDLENVSFKINRIQYKSMSY